METLTGVTNLCIKCWTPLPNMESRLCPECKHKQEIKKEIHDLNIQIENNLRIMNDYRLLQTGDFNKEELREENKSLMLERNKLLSQL